MELALFITTPGLVHIFEEIINQMDTRSVVSSALVCKDWWKVIQNHPKRLRIVIRRIRFKKALIYPDFRESMESVEAKKEINALVLVLRQFCEDKKNWHYNRYQ
jgi:hypothetical protein